MIAVLPYAQWYAYKEDKWKLWRKKPQICWRKKLKPNWSDNYKSDQLSYLAGRSSRLDQILLMAFVLRTRLSICLSVCPPLFLFTHTHVLTGKYSHPLHFHHGDTWPSMSLCCSSVLVSFLILLLSFSLLCLADYEWIKQFCVKSPK